MKKIYIHQIRSGEKTIEGRIDKGPVKNLQVAKTLRFYYMSNAQDDVICRIQRIQRYSSFADMLEHVDYKTCVPRVRSKQEALDLYLGIPGYAEKEKKYGVCAIWLEVIKG